MVLRESGNRNARPYARRAAAFGSGGPVAERRAAAARNAAQDYLSAAGVNGTVSITDGTTITVNVTDTYRPKFLSIIGLGGLPVTGEASARLIRTVAGSEQ